MVQDPLIISEYANPPGIDFASTDSEIGKRDCTDLILSSPFQQIVPITKAQPQMTSHSGSEFSEQVLHCKNFQDGDYRDLFGSLGSLCKGGNE